MDLKDFHDTVRYFLNKEQGGWIAPEEIDTLTERAQMWWFSECLPFYGKTQKSTDPLLPFLTKHPFTTTGSGIVTLPTDPAVNPCYLTLPTISIAYSDGIKTRYKPIKIFPEDEIAERRDSQILEPTITDPIAQEVAPGTIQLYPEAVMSGHCFYLRKPRKPKFDYTQPDREIIYNLAGSVQLEWSETSINKILVKTIQMCGVNINDQMLIQYTELKNSQDI